LRVCETAHIEYRPLPRSLVRALLEAPEQPERVGIFTYVARYILLPGLWC